MRVTFLGTGSAMPTGERFQSGLLVESGDRQLLVDCGSGALHGLARTETGYEGVDTVLLTHHHLDHVSDLLALLKARWLEGSASLTVAGPPGTAELLEGLLEVHEYLQGRVELEVREITPADRARVAGFEVTAMETRHSMYCQAYRLRGPENPATLTVSGDTEAFEELIEFADGSAVLVHDCSFPDSVEVSNHPTPASLGEALAGADASVGRVYLTHFYPQTEGNHEAMLASIGERYDGDVRVARDGLSISVS